MQRILKVGTGMLVFLTALAADARAQWGYPRGYGGYGMSRWGQDPASGYMAGLGSYARGQGVYQVDQAKADAINVDTMVKWNKALRARQAALREEKRKEAQQQEVARERRADRFELQDGTTLNSLLSQILDIDPTAAKASRAHAPISASAIREIPFEWDSEALSVCLDQLTGNDSLPAPLMLPIYADQRDALRAAVNPALKEDMKGNVSTETRKQIDKALTSFRTKFKTNSADFTPGYDDAMNYFTTMASLSRLLGDPVMKTFLTKLANDEERSVGDLVSFMNAHNLRFGPATSNRQIEIYTRLVPLLAAIRDHVKTEDYVPSTPDRSGEGLKSAAKEAFGPMQWDELQAHGRD